MDKKELVINSAFCDTRTATEEVLNLYESIEINAATVLVSKESKELLSRYNISINTAETIEISKDTEVITHNGSFEISKSTKMSKPTILIINGSLEIKKEAADALKNIVSIHVNGYVSYPSDLQNQLPPISVNGTIESYPSDAIRLKNKQIIDKIFILKAKSTKYYAKNKIIIADESLDLSSLITKGTSFITKKAVIAENLLEDAIKLFEDDTDIMIIPSGYRYIEEETLNDFIINKYGDKIYVDGDLIINSDSENALSKLTGIRVNGSILIVKKLVDRLLNLDVEYKDIKVIKGKIIKDKGNLSINKNTLSGITDGVTISDCGMVKISSDITPEEIEEKLQFFGCGYISCHPDQRGAVELVSEDVGFINDEDKAESADSSLYNKNTQVINSASYNL